MVSKPTGQRRGRPRKPIAATVSPKPAHRPKKTLFADPERFALAQIVALMASGRTERWASSSVAWAQRVEPGSVSVTPVGELNLTPLEIVKVTLRRRSGAVVGFRIRHGSTASIRSHARALVLKLKRYQKDPAAERWLLGVSQALSAANATRDPVLKAFRLRHIPAVDIALRPSQTLITTPPDFSAT